MPLMDAVTFGRKLIETNDLDPVYVVLHNARFDEWAMKKWLLAYWCFYHAGTASCIVDHATRFGRSDFWDGMEDAAKSKDWPRNKERRHFRGQAAIDSVAWLKQRGVSMLMNPLFSLQPQSLAKITKAVGSWRGFGPWISFKAADMLERLGLCPVEFDVGQVFLYDSPQAGAIELYRLVNPTQSEVSGAQAGAWAVDYLLSRLVTHVAHRRVAGAVTYRPEPYRAPPRYERAINVQEAETVLCKWKSYRGGHYRLGEDVEGLRESLDKYARVSPTAARLLAAGDEAQLWSTKSALAE